MKICIINSFYYPDIIGGAEVSVKHLAEKMVSKDNEISILCTGFKEEVKEINKVKVYRIEEKNVYRAIDLLINKNINRNKLVLKIYHIIDFINLFNYKKIKEKLIEINPDVLHVNNIYGLSLIVIYISCKLNIPIIFTARDYSLLYEHNNNLLSKIKRIVTKKIMRNIDVITAPSKYTLNYFDENGYRGKNMSEVIFNAIDYDKSDVKKIHEYKINNILKKEKINFVYLGRLEKDKGILELLRVFNKYKNKDIVLNIAGKGNEEKNVLEYAKKDNRIKYLGFLEEYELDKLLKESDVLIIPSRWPEPFGRVILDAYKYCMPVIGTNMGGIPEIVDQNKTGILINNNNLENELEKAIIYFSKNKNILNNMINIESKLNDFNICIQVEKFTEVYKRIKMEKKHE
ncbi:glycosyltransferase family 4 protein [Clostridium perfringens]|uniref:glycosyltransferase family 4 protein n=1 Tax=Clostridium perfringens TaxID=1502 RepID=UPI0024BD2B8C|nr:glycosyltransferase family 4 protein [Clostridium perfringens]